MLNLKEAKGFRAAHEDGAHYEPAPRQHVTFKCPKGCEFSMPFAIDVEPATVWECRAHGVDAEIVGGVDRVKSKKAPRVRTHWDMLRERRSIPELESLLRERLDLLRSGRPGN